MQPCFFIFGMGYTAEFLAQKLAKSNFKVIGTTRDEEKLEKAHSSNYQLIHYQDSDLCSYLKSSSHILLSAPPTLERGDPVLADYGDELKKLSLLKWLGYLSSTSVYGDHQSGWVNELSPSLSVGKQGQLRLQAEKDWLNFSQHSKIPLHIFRLAGIYGPNRNALSRIQTGKEYSIFKEGQFFSRIHVEDLACLLLASSTKPKPFSIYNLADDEPAPSHIVDAYAAALLHRPPLPLIPYELAKLSVREKDFYANNRRVSNAKIKKEFALELLYPTYREGLRQLYKLWMDENDQTST
ncbi:MAG: SDR family oxidoreductase [Tatlockia sp.]|nr:SDR family oxidoreductase [Tatlockia sp.]